MTRNTHQAVARSRLLAILATILTAASASPASADPVGERVIHSFTGASGDGASSASAPTLGKDGSFYGVTPQGGSSQLGMIYKLAADGTTTSLYSFPAGDASGDRPVQSLVRDADGNFYGMANNGANGGRGTIFKITPDGSFTVLHTLSPNATEGRAADNGLALGKDGYLYGVAAIGGAKSNGTFFRLKRDGSGFAVLHSFDPSPGLAARPQASLVRAADGSFYGLAAYVRDDNNIGYGAVYRITTAGVMTTLYAFMDNSLEPPTGTPQLDAAGNLYFYGSASNSTKSGRIYKLDTAGALSTLHHFTALDGQPGPYSKQLYRGKDGRLYGTAANGGSHAPADPSYGAYGTVFSLGLDGAFAVLHNFGAANDGTYPLSSPVAAKDGSLWGVTSSSDIPGVPGTAYQLDKPTEKFSVKPTSITLGQSTKLKWSSLDTTGCASSGAWGPGTLPISGSQLVVPAAAGSYTYTLTCAGAGSTARSVTLTVN